MTGAPGPPGSNRMKQHSSIFSIGASSGLHACQRNYQLRHIPGQHLLINKIMLPFGPGVPCKACMLKTGRLTQHTWEIVETSRGESQWEVPQPWWDMSPWGKGQRTHQHGLKPLKQVPKETFHLYKILSWEFATVGPESLQTWRKMKMCTPLQNKTFIGRYYKALSMCRALGYKWNKLDIVPRILVRLRF